jgi:hypothetical protein
MTPSIAEICESAFDTARLLPCGDREIELLLDREIAHPRDAGHITG